ncbi:MAG: PIG-L deacetylase family protein [Acidimicrobiia bacterium]
MEEVREATNEGIERILVVSAHPDDVDFGVAGSIATWTSAGIDVSYCIVTDGDAGGSDLELPRPEMARTRRVEQAAAAATVGVTDLHFLAYPDGRLQPTLELRRDLSRVIRLVRPQRVVCQSPERIWERVYASHPDHLAAGEATVSAVYPDARNPFAHPELLADGLEPWTVPELWLMAHPGVDVYVDTTDTIDKKIAALQCHVSQIPDPAGLDERMRDWGAMIAARVGLPEGRLAEAFQSVDAA